MKPCNVTEWEILRRSCYLAALKCEILSSWVQLLWGLQRGLGLIPDGKVYTSKQVEKLVEVYSNLRVQYPRSAAAKVRFQKHTVFGSRLWGYRDFQPSNNRGLLCSGGTCCWRDLCHSLIFPFLMKNMHWSCWTLGLWMQRIPLDFLQEGAFKAAVSEYVRPFLREVWFFLILGVFYLRLSRSNFSRLHSYLDSSVVTTTYACSLIHHEGIPSNDSLETKSSWFFMNET